MSRQQRLTAGDVSGQSLTGSHAIEPENRKMSNLVNLVRVRVQPEVRERLMPAMLENARQSVLEDTCYQFDVIQSRDDENEFVFYEVYKNEEALATHRETPHFLAYFDLIQELGDRVERTPLLYEIIS